MFQGSSRTYVKKEMDRVDTTTARAYAWSRGSIALYKPKLPASMLQFLSFYDTIYIKGRLHATMQYNVINAIKYDSMFH